MIVRFLLSCIFVVQFRGQPAGAHPGDRLFAPERDDRVQPDRQSAKGRFDLLHDQAQHQIGYAVHRTVIKVFIQQPQKCNSITVRGRHT